LLAKRLNLLWRGSRDDLRAAEFHRRCDGRANTVTLISDTVENIVGGFAPVKWESSVRNGKQRDNSNLFKGYESGRSFLFRVTNPYCVSLNAVSNLLLSAMQSIVYWLHCCFR
jgi:hypothetical protein